MKFVRQSDAIEVSVVIPCLNEQDTLATCIEKARRAFRERNIAGSGDVDRRSPRTSPRIGGDAGDRRTRGIRGIDVLVPGVDCRTSLGGDNDDVYGP